MTNDEPTPTALRRLLRQRYGVAEGEVLCVWAPYRVCPLGAHIDHQLGTVTAMTIDHGVHLAFAPTHEPEIRLASLAYPGEVRFCLDAIPPRQPGDWGNYARGAAWALSRRAPLSRGFVGVTSGDLGEAGLSSSAAIGLAYLLALEEVNGWQVDAAENIRLDQAIENDYLGLNNGILDQSAILLSRRDQLTVIDCKVFAEGASTADAGELPPGIRRLPPTATMPPLVILLAFSGLSQPVIATGYNRRVVECAEAARVLLDAAGRPGAPPRLAEVTAEEYARHRTRLSGAPAKRAAHFFSEMQRVREGLVAWSRGDLAAFGRLVTESGESSIRNYECGAPAMIDLFEILKRTAGVYGARFSGAGFRGCCLALAAPEAAESIAVEVRRAYARRHPEPAAGARVILCHSADGARVLAP